MFEDKLESDECPICFEITSSKIIKCNHFLCITCFTKLNNLECPICRQNIDIKPIVQDILGCNWVEYPENKLFVYASYKYIPNNDKSIFYKIGSNLYNLITKRTPQCEDIDNLITNLEMQLRPIGFYAYKYMDENLGYVIYIGKSFNGSMRIQMLS